VTRTDLNIGLLWHSASSGNLGVGALTLANMAIVREVARQVGVTPHFTIIGMRDGVETYVPESEAPQFVVDTRSLVSPGGCWKTMRAQDCVLDIGGGDSFTDIYANKRYAFIWGTKAIAIAAGRPLMLCPQTIGPFSKQPHTALAAYALRHAAAVVARDSRSFEVAKALAPKTRTVLSTDVAFALPFQDRGAERNGPKVRVGVNVSGLLFNEATKGANRFGLQVDYAVLMRGLMDELHRRGAEVHLITHANDPRPWDDDGRAADLFAQEYPWAIRVPNFPGPMEAKSYISSLDFLVSGRMHACIGAVSSGTPVVPIAYSRKFSGVFGLIDYPALVDVAGMTTEAALAFVLAQLDARAELAAAARRSMEKVQGFLDVYRAELSTVLRKAAAA
jgi:polysaccharide pyruvyl transferase WcaK-like protein